MPDTVELEIKPTRTGNVRVLAVLASALAISVTVILLLSGLSKGFSVSRTTLYTYLPDATGLTTTSEVRVSGLHVGTVSKVELSGLLDPQRAVRVDMRVGTQYLPMIPQNSITSISTDTLVGPAFVSIAEGDSPAIIRANATLASEPLKQAADRADLVRAFEARLRDIDQVIIDISSPNTPVGKFIVGDAEYTAVLGQITSFERSLHNLMSPRSPVGQALFTEDLYNRVRRPLTQMDRVLAEIQNGEGKAGHLFASEEQYNLLLRQLRELHQTLADINAGKGAGAELLRSNEAHARVLAVLRSSNQLLDQLTTGPGTGAEMLRNPQMYEALNGALLELAAMMKDVRENPKKYLRYKPF